MPWWIDSSIIISLQLFAIVAGLIHFSKVDKASKTIIGFIFISMISEIMALIFIQKFGKNLIIYNIYNLISFLILCLYFEKLVYKLPAKLIAGIGISAYIVDLFIQDFNNGLVTYFIMFQNLLTIALCLYYYYQVLASDIIEIHLSPHFWITALILVFSCFTFFYWSVGLNAYQHQSEKSGWIMLMIQIINIVFYSSMGIIFLFYNKLRISD